MSQYKLVGTARNLDEITSILNARRVELGLTLAELNSISGFAGGYTNKVFARGYAKNLGRLSMPVFLEALGLKCVIVADDNALPPITRRAISERTGSANRASKDHARPAA